MPTDNTDRLRGKSSIERISKGPKVLADRPGRTVRQIAANVDNCDIHSNFLASPGPISSRFSALTFSLEFPSPRPLRHSTTTPKARHH